MAEEIFEEMFDETTLDKVQEKDMKNLSSLKSLNSSKDISLVCSVVISASVGCVSFSSLQSIVVSSIITHAALGRNE